MLHLHEPMSFAEFERLPRRPGWRYEYLDGRAHVTPCGGVALLLDLRERPGARAWPVPDGVRIRPVDAVADRAALEHAFAAAFQAAPEFPGAQQESLALEAARYLSGFFGSHRGTPSARSRVLEIGGRVVAAALVKKGDGEPLLDCLLTHPAHARRGLASAAAEEVARGLAADGERRLESFVMLANETSLAWHARFGFQERPDALVATHRWRAYAQEAERGRRFGLLHEAEIHRLEELAGHWRSEARRLASESGSERPGTWSGASQV